MWASRSSAWAAMAKVAMLAVVVILSLEVDHAVTCAFMSKTVSLTAVADGWLAGQ
jgi:hypothetical protein